MEKKVEKNGEEKTIIIPTILEKLSMVQNELKAPKSNKNTFGNYKYRSCEDILESVKPILAKNRLSLVLTDTLENIGERYYIKATTKLYDLDSEVILENTAYAREEESKKGMDGSQITGTASSYARKYALNGLFNIDDTKDADTDEYTKRTTKSDKELINDLPINEGQKQMIADKYAEQLPAYLMKIKKKKLSDLTFSEAEEFMNKERLERGE